MSRVHPGGARSASRCCSATAARTLSGTPRYQPQSSCRSWTTPTIPRRTSTSRRPGTLSSACRRTSPTRVTVPTGRVAVRSRPMRWLRSSPGPAGTRQCLDRRPRPTRPQCCDPHPHPARWHTRVRRHQERSRRSPPSPVRLGTRRTDRPGQSRARTAHRVGEFGPPQGHHPQHSPRCCGSPPGSITSSPGSAATCHREDQCTPPGLRQGVPARPS
jgi:hypothetical protein